MLKFCLPLYVFLGLFLLQTSVFSKTISNDPDCKDAGRSFLFDGVNKRGNAYGYPYQSATGIINGGHVKNEDCSGCNRVFMMPH